MTFISLFSWSLYAQNEQTTEESASETNPNEIFYKSFKGSLETAQDFIIPNGSFMKVVAINPPWVTVKAFNEEGEPLKDGEDLDLSKYWFEKATKKTTFTQVVELVSRPLDLDPGEDIRLEDCLRAQGQQSGSDVIQTLTGSPDIKLSEPLYSYFKCYQKESKPMTRYSESISPSIKKISEAYHATWNQPLPATEFETLLSCLIFRESSHFKGKSSPTGAVGIGQFTYTAIRHMKKVLSLKPQDNFEERLAPRIAKLNGNSISQTTRNKLNKEVELIRAEERNYKRALAAKNLFDTYPLDDKPKASQLNDAYFKDPKNDEAVLLFSMMLVMDCEVKMIQSNSTLKPENRLLACMGAYNMGTRGFYRYALRGNQSEDIGDWVNNLRASSSPQRHETINHLVSINRCAKKDGHYPPCGTSPSYCQNLDNTNPCVDSTVLKCVGECP